MKDLACIIGLLDLICQSLFCTYEAGNERFGLASSMTRCISSSHIQTEIQVNWWRGSDRGSDARVVCTLLSVRNLGRARRGKVKREAKYVSEVFGKVLFLGF